MLEKFGLTETEEKVYLILLKIGESPASEIIKKSQLHRTTVYDVLERLIEKGLASYVIKNKISYYSPAEPSKFLDIALEGTKEAQEKQKLATEIVKQMGLIKKESKEKSIAQIFVGEKGQKTIMNDIIEVGKEFYILGGGGKFKTEMPLYTEQWAEQRRRKNIKAKIISSNRKEAAIWKLNKIKYIDREYPSPSVTMIYGNKVALFIQDRPILIILIESEKVAESYKEYFNLIWKIAKN